MRVHFDPTRKPTTLKSLICEIGGLLQTLGTLMISVMEDKTRVLLEYALEDEKQESEERAKYFVDEFDKSINEKTTITTKKSQYPERFISDGIMGELEDV